MPAAHASDACNYAVPLSRDASHAVLDASPAHRGAHRAGVRCLRDRCGSLPVAVEARVASCGLRDVTRWAYAALSRDRFVRRPRLHIHQRRQSRRPHGTGKVAPQPAPAADREQEVLAARVAQARWGGSERHSTHARWRSWWKRGPGCGCRVVEASSGGGAMWIAAIGMVVASALRRRAKLRYTCVSKHRARIARPTAGRARLR
jgi:MYXO-CTERM domain-containing protein